MQVVWQLQKSVHANDLASIHNEDAILAMDIKALSTRLDVVAAAQREAFLTNLTVFAQNVGDLHLAGDLGQLPRAKGELAKVEESFEKVKSFFPEWTVSTASKSTNVFMCPMHRDVVGSRTNFCGKCGMELDQLIRVLPPDVDLPGAGQTVRASIRTGGALKAGKLCAAILRLEKMNGEPIYPTDLIETHTKRIHLLIIDQTLTDYHHEHPVPTKTPGEYAFSFTPKKNGNYRAWADLRPNPFGVQEYAITDIAGQSAETNTPERTLSTKTSVDGLNYDLQLSRDEIRAGIPVTAKLRITKENGESFAQLEPIMAAFAHLVGFNEDFRTVLHMHPKGAILTDPNARGGPELEFQIYALKPGFYKLFAQVQIDGRSRFAPFGIKVVP